MKTPFKKGKDIEKNMLEKQKIREIKRKYLLLLQTKRKKIEVSIIF